MPLASEIMDETAAILNDVNKSMHTYAAQLPYLKMALDDLEGELINAGLGKIRKQHTDTVVPASSVPSGFPSPPAEMFLPIELFEKSSGQTDDAFTPIYYCRFLPNKQAGNRLQNYTFNGPGTIEFPACTNSQTVRLFYSDISPNNLVDQTTDINFVRVKRYLASSTAYLISKYVLNSQSRMATTLEDRENAKYLLLNPMIQMDQAAPVRRVPYGRLY